jgi:hypothetical protein
VKSFHQSNEVSTKNSMETNKIEKDSFKLMYRTALAMQEKRESETKRGQKED